MKTINGCASKSADGSSVWIMTEMVLPRWKQLGVCFFATVEDAKAAADHDVANGEAPACNVIVATHAKDMRLLSQEVVYTARRGAK